MGIYAFHAFHCPVQVPSSLMAMAPGLAAIAMLVLARYEATCPARAGHGKGSCPKELSTRDVAEVSGEQIVGKLWNRILFPDCRKTCCNFPTTGFSGGPENSKVAHLMCRVSCAKDRPHTWGQNIQERSCFLFFLPIEESRID